MPKIISWDENTAKDKLKDMLSYSKEQKREFEFRFEENERTLLNTRGIYSERQNISISFESEAQLGLNDIDQGSMNVGINYVFKNLRLIHSQLSANPPTVIARPTSPDTADRAKADAADRLIRFAIRRYKLQEVFDSCSLNTLTYGTGFIKTVWNSEAGEIVDFDEETGEVEMDGEIQISSVTPWNIYIDPDATSWDEVKWVFEKISMPFDEACFRFPEKIEMLEELRRKKAEDLNSGYPNAPTKRPKYDVVDIFQYWEKGLPHNGMVGRFCFCDESGRLLTPVKPNPHRFSPPRTDEDEKPLPARAELPYHIFTDVDIPNIVWGKAVIDYEIAIQDAHNRMLGAMLDSIEAHGVARLLVPESAELNDEAIGNSAFDIIKYTGNIPPNFMQPMPIPNTLPEFIGSMKLGIDDMAGVNEAMFGQMSRETSGFSMQYATNQGNMIRRRLFNKYVLLTENVYKAYLNLIRRHWQTPRIIKVLGEEKAFESIDIKGADIDGGFDLVVEYGASLSLDPVSRREEMLTLMPLFEKAGVEPRTILQMLKLNELEGLYDRVQLASDRQREIFEEMIAINQYIAPKPLEDHKYMLEYALTYVMTAEYKYLDDMYKELIDRHIEERIQMTQPQAGAGAPGPAGMPGMPQAPLPGPQAPLDAAAGGPAPADLPIV